MLIRKNFNTQQKKVKEEEEEEEEEEWLNEEGKEIKLYAIQLLRNSKWDQENVAVNEKQACVWKPCIKT
jgi:hypothetical protein